MEYCPKCYCIVEVIRDWTHTFIEDREERICRKCGQTISIHHYPKKKGEKDD